MNLILQSYFLFLQILEFLLLGLALASLDIVNSF